MDWVCSKLGYEGVFVVDSQGRSGGLALMWRDVEKANLLSYSHNNVDIEVKVNRVSSWRITGLYIWGTK